jgi:hypothetical protein
VTDEQGRSSDPTRRWWLSSKDFGTESGSLCRSCLGTGVRPPTGLLVVLGGLSISMGEPRTSPAVWWTWTRRLLLALAASDFVADGWFTSILADLVGS